MPTLKRVNHELDAAGKTVGRLASQIAQLLIGKHKRTFAPHLDGGDYVLVKNVRQLNISASKSENKDYRHYSGYPGGLKRQTWGQMFAKNPERVLYLAVLRMLPKNRLRKNWIKRLTFEV